MHECASLEKQGYISESNIHDFDGQSVQPRLHIRAKMGSLSPVMSTVVILLEAVMHTSHSQGAVGVTGGGAGWNSHICLSSTTYVSEKGDAF